MQKKISLFPLLGNNESLIFLQALREQFMVFLTNI